MSLQTLPHNRPTTFLNPLLRLQSELLPPHAISLLNKGPKFALTHQKIPFMNIIFCTLKAAQSLERVGLPKNGEKLRQDVSNILYLKKRIHPAI